MLDAQTLEDLASCLEYPREKTSAAARRLTGVLPITIELADWLEVEGVRSAEERYTVLFDLKPVCTLNLGYHLLGDTYQRGALLACLAAQLNVAGVDYLHDLPDYLPTLIRLLATLDDPEDRVLLVHSILVPGLNKINTALKESPGAWPALLRSLPELFETEEPKLDAEIPKFHRPLEVLPCSM